MMQHPFINDLSDKTLEELQTAIVNLTSKLIFASRMQNVGLAQQIQMVLESYKSEYYRKTQEMYKKQNIDGHINITKNS
jgi:ABC-type ATPase with predicted acetyltransferase domain